MFSAGFTLLSVLLLFPVLISPSSALCSVFDSIWGSIYLPICYVFVPEDFKDHHKEWITYSGETDILILL